MKRSRTCVVWLTILVLALSCKPENPQNAPTTSADTDKSVVLRVWQTETDKDALKVLDRVRSEFEKRHPGVTVQIESVAWSSLSAKLAAALASNNPPDVAHLEPFMVASVYSRNLLLPIGDVIDAIEKDNGDTIFPTLRDLQHINGQYYGIAYAVGTTGFAYRKDVAQRLGLTVPTTWSGYVAFVNKMARDGGPEMKLLLPGGDQFFIDQLTAELLANNDGRLFDPQTNRPELDKEPFIETLQLFRDLTPALDKGWLTQKYLDQFNRLGHGEAGNVPVCYARATRAIAAAKTLPARPDVFGWMPQPRGPRSRKPAIATMDCEPFVIFKAAAARSAGDKLTNADLGKEFLRLFYAKRNYLDFVKTVPIHLTPIFQGMAASPEYTSTPALADWKPWHEQTVMFLQHPEQTRPILMPDVSPAGKALPYLLEFQSRRILTQAVVDVVGGTLSPHDAAIKAQRSAEQVVESTGNKGW